NESVARLQEQGRYVMSVLEPDIELAGYYAFTNSADTIRLIRGNDLQNVVASASAMRQRPVGGTPVTPAPDLPPAVHSCGTNFAVDVLSPVEGSNDVFELGPAAAASCGAYGNGAVPNTDTLTIRRASTEPGTPRAGRLQLYATRFSSQSSQQLFMSAAAPGPVDADRQIRDLVVRTYYVSKDSVDRAGYPALRVKSLTEVGGSPAFLDTEVLPGVEDFQVQFGIDTGDYNNDGAIDPGSDVNGDGIPESDGRATRYVDPQFPGLNRAQIVSVRVWVRIRADSPEQGFIDGKTYRYSNVEFTPTGAERGYRRVLVSRTITLRNARTL
ncbi:MAG: PilW family protein, partial [Steroidobacteraceae bacterium]